MFPQTLIVARDPGAANALAPVAATGLATVVGLGHAQAFFRQIGVACHLEDDTDPSVAGRVLDEVRPQVLLTGTSLKITRDAAWWEAAHALGIPSVALLDHWTAFGERFTVTNAFDKLPDAVAVMDEHAREQMLALGCPARKVVVTGQPAFDELVRQGLPDGAAVREEWGAAANETVIVFASEPQAHDFGAGLGYTETDALQMVAGMMRDLSARLVVKPHPREKPEGLAVVLNGAGISGHIETDMTPRQVMAGADAVIGMTSIFLLEAALAGRHALSVQPGKRADWTVQLRELIPTVTSTPEVAAWLENKAHLRVLSERARIARNEVYGFTGKSTERVWALLATVSGRTM